MSSHESVTKGGKGGHPFSSQEPCGFIQNTFRYNVDQPLSECQARQDFIDTSTDGQSNIPRRNDGDDMMLLQPAVCLQSFVGLKYKARSTLILKFPIQRQLAWVSLIPPPNGW